MAASVLMRIKDRGAYSNVVLPQVTKDSSRQDSAFVFSLVHGALRRIRLVDAIIEEASGRGVDRLDSEVRVVLEVAVGELLTDDQQSTYATVNESVEAVKDLGRNRAAPFVNAVLRSLVRDGMPELPEDPARDLSVPDWLLDAVSRDHGADEGLAALRALRRESPRIPIRVPPSAEPPPGAMAVPGIRDAFYLSERPRQDAGLVYADASSTAVGLAVAPQPGEMILDMAAAPGGKTMHLWDQTGGKATIVAMDTHRRRLESAQRRLRPVGVTPTWLVADARHAPFADASFDAVLVDAPCTGLGTLRRRPEIAMRLQDGAPEKLAIEQERMIAEAWRLARPGGRVIYSVCTLFAAETIDVVADYPAQPPEGLPGRRWGKGLLLAPHTTGSDGMFIAVITR
jgi:16S rRNA (cytosine967-C5)-methyltransferase